VWNRGAGPSENPLKKKEQTNRTSFSEIIGIKNMCGDAAGVPIALNSQVGFLFSRVLFQATITWET